MSEGMLTISLGALCTMVRGTYPTLKTEPGEYPLVVTAAYRRSASTFQMEGPAVCIPLISSTGHGDAALHRVHYQDGKFALANLLVALLPKNPHVCDARYLYHLLNTKKDQYLVPLMLGTANVSLKEKDIAGVQVSLPPLPEQRRIVARIDELAAKIEEARRLRREAVENASAIIPSASKVEFEQHSGSSQLLGNILTAVQNGFSGPQGDFVDGALPVSRIETIQEGGFDLNRIKFALLSLEQRQQYEYKDGDIAFSHINSLEKLGKVGFYRSEYGILMHGVNILRLQADKSICMPKYLFWYFLSPASRDQYSSHIMQSVNQVSINQAKLKSISMPLPSLTEQERIVAYLDGLQAKVDALKALQGETAAELSALLPSVLDRAFSGRL